jgi:hypothetical protein
VFRIGEVQVVGARGGGAHPRTAYSSLRLPISKRYAHRADVGQITCVWRRVITFCAGSVGGVFRRLRRPGTDVEESPVFFLCID